jgi:hypothetical protein
MATERLAELDLTVADIRRAFYDDFAQGDRHWWVDRELQVIAEDPDASQRYVVPVSFDGDRIAFGDPKEVADGTRG